MKWDERWIKVWNGSWIKEPVKVQQINEYLFSDTVQSQKTKSGSDEISQGQTNLSTNFQHQTPYHYRKLKTILMTQTNN